ncbi:MULTISPECIES: VWA domain-containing protein [unclassified Rhizobium]|uniref:vWA domain-containing protein n=1 Tax=unclassified Rhizobium TaxID=2613769 RepID=UPI001A98CE9E|nr:MULTISPECIES: VWA domain-containing protein [unclassified Rhizobium]MBX5156556.1 VWA domain-containing protein [Rhizobium sp. NZLR8]MBX5162681.1 VWA domain-containing protein [Rhizobium sp. NZLR4b]MBX5168269.1 VWA domain-containing protein [Rhizobium sp. NZLR1b]MBX5182122.1 VWA domain-containing protein [Rhizobium sp. NZLR5]MBX5187534.1 VWA domain-containing protein [Rhizobium sp. NZLR3b]
MTVDKELEKLSRLTPPAADPEARVRALAAAMQAFDGAENNVAAAQGNARGWRQSSVINWIWSPAMNKKFLAGSALATLLVIPAAGYLVVELTRNGLPIIDQTEIAGNLSQNGTSKPAEPAGKPADPVAAAPQLPEAAAEENKLARSSAAGNAEALQDKEQQAAAKAKAPQTSEFDADEMSTLLNKSEGSATTLGEAKRSIAPGIAPQQQPAEPMAAVAPSPAPPADGRVQLQLDPSHERFANAAANPIKSVATDPVSTFSADVDSASYSFVRRSLTGGAMPDPQSVRVEEMINYFPYDWPGPDKAEQPFKATVTVMPTPWNHDTELMHVAIKGYDIAPATAPHANLVFLIDVSGSMDEPDKLPLLKSAFRLLVNRLKADDTVSIVTYAGNAGTVLQPTRVMEKSKILSAIDRLEAGGSTGGAEGIEAAYDLAKQAFVKDGVNRVMLATDGDFNVGPSSDEDLKRIIEERRKDGIFLTVLGFGRGNLNDSLMQTLAQNGNGSAAYIDTLAEAQKTLVEEAGSTLFPIAKDVKFQVEFNPERIAEYRLIGYETRALNREDFNNDRVDAGDIGSGHSVTAIYEITPKGSPAVMNDDLRYGAADKAPAQASDSAHGGELAFVKMRYKRPGEDKSALITTPVDNGNVVATVDAAPQDVRFSVAVAAFGQKLSRSAALDAYSYQAIVDLAAASRGTDPFGYRSDFLGLVRLADGLSQR